VALKASYNVFDGDFSQLNEAVCGCVIIIRKAGRVRVAGDHFGGYHLFRNAMTTMVSLSFLIAATAIDQVTVTAQSIFEYVLNGVVSSNETLIAELSLLPIGSSLTIDGENVALQLPTLEPPRVRPSCSRETNSLSAALLSLIANSKFLQNSLGTMSRALFLVVTIRD
jgi:hypothetical protein